MRHSDVILTEQCRHRTTSGKRAADVLQIVFYLSIGLVRECEIEISNMGKINGNLDLVCRFVFKLGSGY